MFKYFGDFLYRYRRFLSKKIFVLKSVEGWNSLHSSRCIVYCREKIEGVDRTGSESRFFWSPDSSCFIASTRCIWQKRHAHRDLRLTEDIPSNQTRPRARSCTAAKNTEDTAEEKVRSQREWRVPNTRLSTSRTSLV